MSPAKRRWIAGTLTGFAYSLVAGLCFMLFARGRPKVDSGDVLTLLLVSILLTALMTGVFVYITPRARKMALVPAVLAQAAGISGVLFFGVAGGVWMTNALLHGFPAATSRIADLLQDHELQRAIWFSLVMLLAFTFLNGVSQKLGPGVLRNWLLGKYHQPRQESRIFMFLDLKGSTALAERLGDLRFSQFIRDVFQDITTPLLANGAEVSHFIGDEVVVTWPLARGVQGGQCIRCYFSVLDEFVRRASHYRDRYGLTPSFKAGMHCGLVVTTEVGQIKSEIVFHGDVLNTAARLQSLCGGEEADLLISDELARTVPAPEGLLYENLGPRQLKGKENLVEVVRVSRS